MLIAITPWVMIGRDQGGTIGHFHDVNVIETGQFPGSSLAIP
jgi:hypothetical protein